MKATAAAQIHNSHIYEIVRQRDELLRTALCIKESRCHECAHRGHCDLEHDAEHLLCRDENYTNKLQAERDELLALCRRAVSDEWNARGNGYGGLANDTYEEMAAMTGQRNDSVLDSISEPSNN